METVIKGRTLVRSGGLSRWVWHGHFKASPFSPKQFWHISFFLGLWVCMIKWDGIAKCLAHIHTWHLSGSTGADPFPHTEGFGSDPQICDTSTHCWELSGKIPTGSLAFCSGETDLVEFLILCWIVLSVELPVTILSCLWLASQSQLQRANHGLETITSCWWNLCAGGRHHGLVAQWLHAKHPYIHLLKLLKTPNVCAENISFLDNPVWSSVSYWLYDLRHII